MNNDKQISKMITFHKDNEIEMKVFRILDRKRYNQSALIIRLLWNFFKMFDLDETTPYDDFCFTINAYLGNDKNVNQRTYKIMQILHGDSPKMDFHNPDTSLSSKKGNISFSSPATQTSDSSVDFQGTDDSFVNDLATGFDSLLY